MVEISLSGSGEGPGGASARGYSTTGSPRQGWACEGYISIVEVWANAPQSSVATLRATNVSRHRCHQNRHQGFLGLEVPSAIDLRTRLTEPSKSSLSKNSASRISRPDSKSTENSGVPRA